MRRGKTHFLYSADEALDERCKDDMDRFGQDLDWMVKDPDFRWRVREDLKWMVANLQLDLHAELQPALLLQSVHGHATEGHGYFGYDSPRGHRPYPYATLNDVVLASGLSLRTVRSERQQLIDGVYKWVDDALDGKERTLHVSGNPLLGTPFIRSRGRPDRVKTLKGMVLAGFMDASEDRARTVKNRKKTIGGRPLVIGSGETYLVDPQLLRTPGFTPRDLANHPHNDEEIAYLRGLGLIVDKGSKTSAYIRRVAGMGTSDDMAFIVIGALHGVDAMLGAYLVDGIDTYDKLVEWPARGGLDEQLAAYIQNSWKHEYGEPLVSDEEIEEVIFYSAKGNDPKIGVSSSHRRFIGTIGDHSSVLTFQAHLDYVERGKRHSFPVGFGRMPSQDFYEAADERLAHLQEHRNAA